MATEEKSLRVITFDGKRSNYHPWSVKFLARARRKGFAELLLSKAAIPKESEILALRASSDADDKRLVSNYDKAIIGFDELTLSIDTNQTSGKVAFSLVETATSPDHPNGHLPTAWKALKKKYEPETVTELTTLETAFYASTLEDASSDPDVWIADLENLRTRILMIDNQALISDHVFILHILSHLPDEYENTIDNCQTALSAGTLTLEELKDKVQAKYSRIRRTHKPGRRTRDKALVTMLTELMEQDAAFAAFVQQFKGSCRSCGKYGHKSVNCPDSKQQSSAAGTSSKFSGKCYHCGMVGHRKVNCLRLKGEQANSAFNEDGECTCPCHDNYPDNEDENELILTAIDQNDLNSVEMHGVISDEDFTLMPDEVSVSACDVTSNEVAYHDREVSIDGDTFHTFTKNTWVGDTGASCDMCHDDTMLFDVTEISEPVQGFSGVMTATKKGKMRCLARQVDGSTTELLRKNVKFCPNSSVNLFSMTESMSQGSKIESDDAKNLRVINGDTTVTFDRRIKTRDGWVAGVDIIPIPNDCADNATDEVPSESDEKKKKQKTYDVNAYHNALGHPSEATTRATANARDIKLIGKFEPCEACMVGKTRQSNLTKTPSQKATQCAERFFLDISSPTQPSMGGKRHWLLVLDDKSDKGWSFFLKQKSDLKDVVLPFLKDITATYGYKIVNIRCDNAGENTALEKLCKQEGLGITFEYTAPGTPQQNGRLERKFATLYGRVRAMLNGADVDEFWRHRLWAEAAQTATSLENHLIKTGKEESAEEQFCGKGVKAKSILDFAHKFGSMCIARNIVTNKKKFERRGKQCIWVGYADGHAVGTNRLIDPRTKRVIFSRDVHFLDKSFGKWAKIKDPVKVPVTPVVEDDSEDESIGMPQLLPRCVSESDDDSSSEKSDDEDDDLIPGLIAGDSSDEEDPSEDGSVSENEVDPYYNEADDDFLDVVDDDDDSQPKDATINQKVVSAMKKLNVSWNEDAQKIVEEAEQKAAANLETGRDSTVEDERLNFLMDMVDISMSVEDLPNPDYVVPKNFQEAWNHPDPIQQQKWREAIRKEFHDMNKRHVWRVINRCDIPHNRRCVKCKWVFNIKRNGVFRARLVACGYSQIPGVDFSENYSPVVHDITFRLLLLAMMLFGLSAKIVDVETAFLYGELEEQIFMDIPLGMENAKSDQALELQKCIYGLVQAARQYFKKAVAILKKIGFEGGTVDPCLFVRKSALGIVYIALYVDDNLLVGKPAAIDEVIDLMRKEGLVLKIEDDLHDYLSCNIKFSSDRRKAWLGQPHLIENLLKKFGDKVMSFRNYKTPGTPGLHTVRPTEDSEKISSDDQLLFRSGVGMLLYLVKHSRPDIANAVRELSKVLDGASPGTFKEMLRVIKYVLDTRMYGLKIEPTFVKGSPWELVLFCDSDYAGDPDSRRSVSGYIIYVCGVPVCWRSKAQRSVTLSSTEAEYVAISEAVKELLFVIQVLEMMMIKVTFPIIVRVDNIGAIFMSGNITTTSRTKHVDIRYKYVNEYAEDGVIKIIFVKSEDNNSDILTKNLGGELQSKHASTMISKMPE